MTVIEIRPFRNGGKCFEASGVEPVFLEQEHAIDYATGRACFRSGEIRILKSSGAIERIIDRLVGRFSRRQKDLNQAEDAFPPLYLLDRAA